MGTVSILRKIPLVGALLKSALDAAGHKIENLGEPTNPHDAATKKYVDENGGGSVKLDDEVTETSENGVKSKGIWSFVKGLFGKLSAVATSGSYNDLADKPKLPTVIELDEATKKLYVMKDGVRTTEEITSWATLFSLTKRGLVRLYYLASGSGDSGRKALYTAHMVDDKTGSTPAILFDATGFIGTNTVWTRTITLTKESTDGIRVEVGKLTEVAKKSDVPAVVAPASDTAFSGKAADAYETGRALDVKADVAKWVFKGKDRYCPKDLLLGVIGKYRDGKCIAFADGKAVSVSFAYNPGQGGGGAEYSWEIEELGPAGYFFARSEDDNIHYNIEGQIQLGTGSISALLTPEAKAALLSGITAQDIADFLRYKGEIVDGGDYSLTYNVGDVLYSVNTENQSETGFWRCISNGARSPYNEPPSWEFIYAKDEGKTGLEKLIALNQFVGLLSRSFRESEISNAAKVTAFTLPVSLFDGITGVKAFNVRCANSSSGSWDARVSWTFEAFSPAGTVSLGTSDVQTMVIGQYTRFTFDQKLSLPVGTTGVRLTCSGATRVALVPTSDAAYTVRGPTGAIITGYGVPIDVIGDVSIPEALALLAKRSLDPRGGVAANVNLTAPDGTRWALGVNNDGTLYTSISDAQSYSDEEIEI